jgi:CDP-diacylglycerol--serine O-phosphatidyltransferase
MKHVVPNAVTLANIAFGFLGILAATEGRFERAVLLFFCGALCDLADGRLARVMGATSKFGMELDSLSDMVSFGIAPAVLVYLAVLKPLGPLGIAIAVLYVLCGAIRLARFNSDAGPLARVTFLGAPIPIAASYMWSLVLVRHALPVWGIAAGVALLAAAMVSTVKIPKFRRGGGLPIAMMLFGLGLYVAFLARPGALTWHAWNGWNVVVIICNYVVLSRRGYLGAGAADKLEQAEKAA